MRVLWFTNIPLEPLSERFGRSGGSGFWMYSLLKTLKEQDKIRFAVVTSQASLPETRFVEGNVEYFNIPASKFSHFRVLEQSAQRKLLRECDKIIGDWKPDLIHVHGTERPFGLVKEFRNGSQVPMLVSLQGIIGVIQRFAFGNMRTLDVIRNMTFGELVRGSTPFSTASRYARQAEREQMILRLADGISGRTTWDKTFANAVSPETPYYCINEVMRDEYWQAQEWSADTCQPFGVFCTTSLAPLKGIDVLLRAVAILREKGLPVTLTVAGIDRDQCTRTCYGRYLLQLLGKLNLDDCVNLAGWMDSAKIVEQLLESSCFVSPSLIENSPNSLCEAQMLGVPCVASHTGGVGSLIVDGEHGILVSPSDEFNLAAGIERILSAPATSQELGKRARSTARKRHSWYDAAKTTLQSYRFLSAKNG